MSGKTNFSLKSDTRKISSAKIEDNNAVNILSPVSINTAITSPDACMYTPRSGEIQTPNSAFGFEKTLKCNTSIHNLDVQTPAEESLTMFSNTSTLTKSGIDADVALSADSGADAQTENGSIDEQQDVNDDETDIFNLQLLPYSDIPGRTPLGELIERKFKEGTSIRIGRQVIRDGIPVGKAKDGDVWFSSKVVSRIHCEMWCRDGTLYIKDIGSSSGTFLNKMRLSPSGKPSRPYPLREGDLLQFGIDYKGKSDDVYKSITVKVQYSNKTRNRFKPSNPTRFRTALQSLLSATNPWATNDTASEAMVDCCICIGSIGPYQALFVAPCSHCYHYKCVHTLLTQSLMFQCPMCRQVANLTASVSMESLSGEETLCRNNEQLTS